MPKCNGNYNAIIPENKKYRRLIAYKSVTAELRIINFSVALLTENLRSCRLDLGHFFSILNDLNGLEGGRGHHKAAVDVKQAGTNVNLGVKAIIEVKKSNL